MGKDRPGSPVTDDAIFPEGALAWDFNYRGELLFLRQAARQRVKIEDGWELFLHGWSQNMCRIYGFELTPELFARMREVADQVRS
jgi:shikimate 5-dehydrogenase